MIYSLTGKLTHIEPTYAVIDVNGVGYRCTASTTTLSQLPSLNEQAFLYTYLYIREDNLELFGFASEEELRCFKLLTSVSGVGPKVALSILSETPPARLLMTIAAGDVKTLTNAPGVGNKVASRIILELKDKVTKEDLTGGFSPVLPTAADQSSQGEAISALVSLGYAQTDAASIVSRLDSSLPVDALIREALKKIGKGK